MKFATLDGGQVSSVRSDDDDDDGIVTNLLNVT